LLVREFDEVSRWLRSLPTDRDFGLTHADFRPGNAIWDCQKVTVIDFDEPVWQWLFVDVARAMLEYEGRPLDERRELLELFLQGYREIRPIDPMWETKIGWFLRYRTLCMYVWSLGDEPDGGSGAWIGDLRLRIQNPTEW
jgi:amicoumacin kinase